MLLPTLHKPVPMGYRVIVLRHYHSDKEKDRTGTIVGVASCNVVFGYIVLLDEPIENTFGKMWAVIVYGSELEGEDGTNWRLDLDGPTLGSSPHPVGIKME